MAVLSYIHLRHGFGGCTSAAYGRPYRLPSTVYPLLHPGLPNNRYAFHPIPPTNYQLPTTLHVIRNGARDKLADVFVGF